MEQEKLRIHKTKYRNRGMANKKLKGENEFHVIFKFDSDEKATDFITKVKEWYYGLEKVGDKIIKAIRDETPETDLDKKPDLHSKETKERITNYLVNKAHERNSFDDLNDALNGLKKDEPKTPAVKKPATAKRKTGRPAKKNIQRQKR